MMVFLMYFITSLGLVVYGAIYFHHALEIYQTHGWRAAVPPFGFSCGFLMFGLIILAFLGESI